MSCCWPDALIYKDDISNITLGTEWVYKVSEEVYEIDNSWPGPWPVVHQPQCQA